MFGFNQQVLDVTVMYDAQKQRSRGKPLKSLLY